jgi:hypothetical protein
MIHQGLRAGGMVALAHDNFWFSVLGDLQQVLDTQSSQCTLLSSLRQLPAQGLRAQANVLYLHTLKASGFRAKLNS